MRCVRIAWCIVPLQYIIVCVLSYEMICVLRVSDITSTVFRSDSACRYGNGNARVRVRVCFLSGVFLVMLINCVIFLVVCRCGMARVCVICGSNIESVFFFIILYYYSHFAWYYQSGGQGACITQPDFKVLVPLKYSLDTTKTNFNT